MCKRCFRAICFYHNLMGYAAKKYKELPDNLYAFVAVK